MTRYHNATRPAHLKGGALVKGRRSYSPNEFRSVQAVGLEQSPAYFTRSAKSTHRAKSAPHTRYSGARGNSREKSPSPSHTKEPRVLITVNQDLLLEIGADLNLHHPIQSQSGLEG